MFFLINEMVQIWQQFTHIQCGPAPWSLVWVMPVLNKFMTKTKGSDVQIDKVIWKNPTMYQELQQQGQVQSDIKVTTFVLLANTNKLMNNKTGEGREKI